MTFTAKYITIAKGLIDDIDQERIAINDKLPSLRSLCKLHNISMTTAMSCYQYLTDEGYAIAKTKQGYFAQKPYHLVNNVTNNVTNPSNFPQFHGCIKSLANLSFINTKRPKANTQSFSTAQLDEAFIDIERIKKSIQSSTKSLSFNLSYDEPQGNFPLRKQLSNHFTTQGFPCAANDLLITHGCLHAVLIALETVSDAGDVIAISSPCYSGLLNILTTLDRKVLEIPSTADGIDIEQIEQAMQQQSIKACLLTANHQNPTGHSINNQQKAKLAALANQYQIPIIEDDVFRELSYQNDIPLPIKYYDKNGWVIWCSSVSKTLAPGLRIGWSMPGRYKEHFLKQRRIRTLGVNQPMQNALADYLSKGHYARHIKKLNKALAINTKTFIHFLSEHLPPNAQIFFPTGGLVLWIKLPDVDTQQLTLELFEQDIFIEHGHNFSTTSLYNNYIRLNLGREPTPQVFEQLTVITNLIRKSITRFE